MFNLFVRRSWGRVTRVRKSKTSLRLPYRPTAEECAALPRVSVEGSLTFIVCVKFNKSLSDDDANGCHHHRQPSF